MVTYIHQPNIWASPRWARWALPWLQTSPVAPLSPPFWPSTRPRAGLGRTLWRGFEWVSCGFSSSQGQFLTTKLFQNHQNSLKCWTLFGDFTKDIGVGIGYRILADVELDIYQENADSKYRKVGIETSINGGWTSRSKGERADWNNHRNGDPGEPIWVCLKIRHPWIRWFTNMFRLKWPAIATPFSDPSIWGHVHFWNLDLSPKRRKNKAPHWKEKAVGMLLLLSEQVVQGGTPPSYKLVYDPH